MFKPKATWSPAVPPGLWTKKNLPKKEKKQQILDRKQVAHSIDQDDLDTSIIKV